MDRTFRLPAVCGLLLAVTPLLASCSSAGSENPAVLRGEARLRAWSEIQRLNRAMEAAFRAGDLQEVAGFYADDGVLAGAQGVIAAGRSEIDAYWNPEWEPVDWQLQLFDLQALGDSLVQTGRSRLTVREQDGPVQTGVVDFVLVWTPTDDGSYEIQADYYE